MLDGRKILFLFVKKILFTAKTLFFLGKLLTSLGIRAHSKGWRFECYGYDNALFSQSSLNESAHNEWRLVQAQGDISVLVRKQRSAFLQSLSPSKLSYYFISTGFNWRWWEERRWCELQRLGKQDNVKKKLTYSSICCIKLEKLFLFMKSK